MSKSLMSILITEVGQIRVSCGNAYGFISEENMVMFDLVLHIFCQMIVQECYMKQDQFI